MNERGEPDDLSEFFKISMLASGTPAAYQKTISESKEFGYANNVCECSPKEAIGGGMICRPTLNEIKGRTDVDFPAALKAVLKRETEKCASEPFDVRILVNCSSIDQIRSLTKHEFLSNRTGKDFHVVTIHSDKRYSEDNENKTLVSTVDGKEVDSEEAYETIERLDGDGFGDDKPVFVFQVGMLGEGINVKSFNSTIVTTHSDRTAMQQIGRVLRNYEKAGRRKIDEGHAEIYAFVENVVDLKKLVLNLQEYDLTADCFDWGKKLDVSTGSGKTPDEDGIDPELNEFEWSDVDEIEILTVLSATESKEKRKFERAIENDVLENDPELFADFVEAMKNDPEYFTTFGAKNSARVEKFDRSKYREEISEPKEKTPKKTGERKKGEKSQTASAIDFFVESIAALKEYLDTHRKAADVLWNLNRKAVLDEVFGNATMTAFFAKFLENRNELASRLAGTAKKKPIRPHNKKENGKEKETCPPISATKSTEAANAPIPENISNSSRNTSKETIASKMSRWLTSLLRK